MIDDLVGSVGKEIGGFYSGVEQKGINCRVLWAKRNYCRPMELRAIFASTGPIKTSYASAHGMRRRTFPMPTVGTPAEPDRALGTRLEECLGDIISWALAMDKEDRNRIIEHPEYYNEKSAEYFTDAACQSSSVWSFIENCLIPVTPRHDDMPQDQETDVSGYIYNCYRAYCIATNKTAMSLDNFKGELRQAIPLNYVPKRKGGTIPAKYFYIKTVPDAFTKSESGLVSCNTSYLKSDGIGQFREWAKNYGLFHPYAPGTIPTVTGNQGNNETVATDTNAEANVISVTPKCKNPVTQNVSNDTKNEVVQAVQGVQAQNFGKNVVCCVDLESTHTQQNNDLTPPAPPARLAQGDALDPPQKPTVTMGVLPKVTEMQSRMLAADTLDKLKEVKASEPDLYAAAIAAWDEDGQRKVWSKHVHQLR